MSDYPVQSFIDLVNFDQSTYAIEDEIHQVEKHISDLAISQEGLQTDLGLAKGVMQDARKVVDRAELQMKELEQQEREEKKRLDQVSNQKEYQSVLKEVSLLKKKQHDYEETLLVAWNKLEVAKKEYELRQVEFEQKLVDLAKTVEEKKEKLITLRSDLEVRNGQREERKKNIPPEWLEKYVLMRSRVDDPVVSVVLGNCSACFYNLPPQDFLELKRKKMLQCKGCYRFLYIEEPQPKIEEPAKTEEPVEPAQPEQ